MTKRNSLYLKNAKVFYLYFFIGILVLFVFFFYQNFSTKSAVNQFLKTSGLSKEDMLYKSVSKSLFGNSLIFYQVKFDSFAFTNHIDKLVLKKDKDGYLISLTNAQIDVTHTIRKTYNINIMEELETYIPIDDILQKPIQSLALSNIDNFTFDLELLLKEEKNITHAKGILTSKNLLTMQFQTKFLKDHNSLNGILKPTYIFLKDEGIFKKYNQYLKSIGYNEKEESLLTQKELKWTHKNMPEITFTPTYQTPSFEEKYF